eukprot:83939-Hanusia_phi.AAC.12
MMIVTVPERSLSVINTLAAPSPQLNPTRNSPGSSRNNSFVFEEFHPGDGPLEGSGVGFGEVTYVTEG